MKTECTQSFPLKFRIMLWILAMFCRWLGWTWRVRIVGWENRAEATAQSPTGSFLLGSFHENAVAGILTHPGQQICNMVSQSKDGEMVAYVCEKIGLLSVRGSSSRGAKEVRDGMIDKIKAGFSCAITVDGPRGPRRVLKNGIVDIARKTGAPVIPISCVGEHSWVLRKTWDKTRIPKPFSRVLVYYGAPIFIPADIDSNQFQDYLNRITAALNADHDRALQNFGTLWPEALHKFPLS